MTGYRTPLIEQYRLFESDKLNQVIGSDYGKTLDQILTDNYGGLTLASLTQTYIDDFDNIAATMGDNNGGKTWCCPSSEISVTSGNFASFSTGNYTQFDATNVALITERNAGIFRHLANAATATFGSTFDATPIINWCQQYGYFECKYKAGDPTGTNAVTWQGFWMRSLGFFGGTGAGETGDPFRVDIEDDIIECYPADPNVASFASSQDRGMHTTVHKHEPKKLTGPGMWGRDVSCGNYVGLRNQAPLGTDNTFEFWLGYHTYSELIMPDYRWYFFDRHCVGRMVMIPETHDRMVPYIWNSIRSENTGGWASGVQCKMLVDYVTCYQHPDLQTMPGGNQLTATALTGGGTANAKTVTSVVAMGAYTNKRSFLIKFATANTSTTTLNVNGLGAKNVYKLPNVDIFPPSGTPIALSGGEIGVNEWKYFIYDTTLNGGAGGFLLWNPNYSMERIPRWAPALLSKPAVIIDVPAFEAGLALKHNIDPTLFPVGHPARSNPAIAAGTPPAMLVNKTFNKISGLVEGTTIGNVSITNTPTYPVRYHQVGGTSHYTVDPATGDIKVAVGYTTALGSEDFLVYAWPTTPMAIRPHSNCTRVFINISSDIDFDLSYFTKSFMWIDAQTTANFTLDGSNNVISYLDRSVIGQLWGDDPAISTDTPPVYNATGFNSLPAIVVTPGTKMLSSLIGNVYSNPSQRLNNITTRNTGNMSIQIQGASRFANAHDYTQNHMGLFVWHKNPSSWTLWVNGTEVGPQPSAPQTGIITDGWCAFAMKALSAGGGGLGQLFNASRFGNEADLLRGLDASVGEIAAGDDFLDQSLIDKIFGYLASPSINGVNRWNLRSLLPANHPYKSTNPKMFR